MDNSAPSILKRAIQDWEDRAPYRDGDHGDSLEHAARIANAILDTDLTDYEIAVIQVAVKWARARSGHFHEDDYRDGASYTARAGQAHSAQAYPDRRGPVPEVRDSSTEKWLDVSSLDVEGSD